MVPVECVLSKHKETQKLFPRNVSVGNFIFIFAQTYSDFPSFLIF